VAPPTFGFFAQGSFSFFSFLARFFHAPPPAFFMAGFFSPLFSHNFSFASFASNSSHF